jgi:hypothetical protein
MALPDGFAETINIVHIRSRHPGDTMKKRISRRQFISTSAAGTAILAAAASDAVQQPRSAPTLSLPNPGPGNWVRWLDGHASSVAQGVTWGTPWPRGQQREAGNFALRGADQRV